MLFIVFCLVVVLLRTSVLLASLEESFLLNLVGVKRFTTDSLSPKSSTSLCLDFFERGELQLSSILTPCVHYAMSALCHRQVMDKISVLT
jgi:hypothetical protein